MNTNDKVKSQRIPVPFYDGTVTNELSADYILPDTYPDVKQILRVRARPVMIGRFISGKRLEFNGAVDYIVIFSAEGRPTGATPKILQVSRTHCTPYTSPPNTRARRASSNISTAVISQSRRASSPVRPSCKIRASCR